jgi:HAD superfamily hydrolase (TIGR01549 family)
MPLCDGVEVACFDLFDTLIRIDLRRLPAVHWQRNEVRSTIPILHERLFKPRGVSLEQLVEAIRGMWTEVRSELDRLDEAGEWPEVPAVEKYRRVASRLGLEEEASETLVHEVAELHHGTLISCAEPVAGAADALARARAAGARTVLVSNWDHASAGPAMLERTGLADGLDHVVISEAVGIRKPDPRIFQAALEPFGVAPARALHVGDLARSDAWGAGRLGFRTVWINPGAKPYPEAEHPPTVTVGSMAELVEQL